MDISMTINALKRITGLFLIMLLSACATSNKPMQVWKNPTQDQAVDRVLVIAAIQRSTQRRVFEDLFIENISGFDVEATASYSLATTGISISRSSIEQAVRRDRLGGILILRLMGYDEKEKYQTPDALEHFRNYDSYYEFVLEEAESGAVRRFRTLMLETSLFDSRSGQLVWSARSELIERSAPRHLIQEQIAFAIIRMAEDGVIPLNP